MTASLQCPRWRAFTLIEILVAVAVLSLLALVLLSISGQAANLWQAGEKANQHRQRARLTLNFLGRELKTAALPIVRSDAGSLHFQINPSTSDVPRHPDALLFQAPIADDISKGKVAALGYFVAWNGTKAALYRVCLGASDGRYNATDPTAAVAAIAGGGISSLEEFAFLENVLGFWVTAYDADGNAKTEWDSRSSHTLPSRIEIVLLLVDAKHAARITSPMTFSHEDIDDPQALLTTLPEAIRPGARFVSLTISPDNALAGPTPSPTP